MNRYMYTDALYNVIRMLVVEKYWLLRGFVKQICLTRKEILFISLKVYVYTNTHTHTHIVYSIKMIR